MIKVLITGGSGMVGRNILESLDFKDYILLSPSSKILNLLDLKTVQNYFQKNEPDIVIHCAGTVGGIQANIKNPVKFLVDNTQMGINLIMTSYESGIKKLINLSSSCTYPKNSENPLTEDLILTGSLEPTNEGYALAKITATKLCEYINKTNTKFEYKTLIPCNRFGKHDKFNPGHSHMLPAAIKKIDAAKKQMNPYVEIWGDGNARREFMFVSDLVSFIAFALKNYDKIPEKINVGLGTDYSINEYYNAISKVIGYQGKFKYTLSKPIGMKQKLMDNSKVKRLGWKPKTTLIDRIKQSYLF